MTEEIFIDTWGWLASGHRKDAGVTASRPSPSSGESPLPGGERNKHALKELYFMENNKLGKNYKSVEETPVWQKAHRLVLGIYEATAGATLMK